MKKFFSIIAIFFAYFIFFSNIAFANNKNILKNNYIVEYKNIEGTNLAIKTKYSNKTLVLADTKDQVINEEYCRTIKKKKIKGNTVIVCKKKNKIILYNNESLFSSFIQDYLNNYYLIKFTSTPDNIRFNVNNKQNKYKNNIEVYIDKNELIVSDINYYDNNNKETNLYSIDEYEFIKNKIFKNYKIENNKINVNYQDIISYKDINLKEYKNIKQIKSPMDKYEITEILKSCNNIKEVYDYINKTTSVNFSNYPLNVIISDGSTFFIFDEKGDKTNTTIKIYNLKDNIFPIYQLYGIELISDKSSLFKKITDLEISFDTNNFIAIDSKSKKGIIDKNGNIKVAIEYDDIIPLRNIFQEEIININDKNAQKLNIEYVGKKNSDNYFIVKKGKKLGLINDKNEFLINLGKNKIDLNNEIKKSKNIITRQNAKDKVIDKTINTIEYYISNIKIFCWIIGACLYGLFVYPFVS